MQGGWHLPATCAQVTCVLHLPGSPAQVLCPGHLPGTPSTCPGPAPSDARAPPLRATPAAARLPDSRVPATRGGHAPPAAQAPRPLTRYLPSGENLQSWLESLNTSEKFMAAAAGRAAPRAGKPARDPAPETLWAAAATASPASGSDGRRERASAYQRPRRPRGIVGLVVRMESGRCASSHPGFPRCAEGAWPGVPSGQSYQIKCRTRA